MGLLAPHDQDHLRQEFASMTRRVHLMFVTQTIGCDTCGQARQILDELPSLSDMVTIDEINLVLEPTRAAAYGIDRAPAIAVTYEAATSDATTSSIPLRGPSPGPALIDTRIRFLGAPSGYEFVSLVQAVLLAGGREPSLSPASRQRVAVIDRPVTMQVFTTPT